MLPLLTDTAVKSLEDKLVYSPSIEFGKGIFFNLTENSKIGFFGNLNAKFNSQPTKRYREGVFGITKQSSDTRPDEQSSFCYSKLSHGTYTLTPSVSLCFENFSWGERIVPDPGDPHRGLYLGWSVFGLEFEAGLPYTRFRSESGWDRNGSFEKYDSEGEKVFGESFGINIYLSGGPGKTDRKGWGRVSWGFRREKFNLKRGKVKSTVYEIKFISNF
jgi:hypothetical protein